MKSKKKLRKKIRALRMENLPGGFKFLWAHRASEVCEDERWQAISI